MYIPNVPYVLTFHLIFLHTFLNLLTSMYTAHENTRFKTICQWAFLNNGNVQLWSDVVSQNKIINSVQLHRQVSITQKLNLLLHLMFIYKCLSNKSVGRNTKGTDSSPLCLRNMACCNYPNVETSFLCLSCSIKDSAIFAFYHLYKLFRHDNFSKN